MWVSDEFGRGIYATIWTPTKEIPVRSLMVSLPAETFAHLASLPMAR